MLGSYPYYRVDALNGNAALSAVEKSALLDEMLGANPATRALLMPERVSSPRCRQWSAGSAGCRRRSM